MLSIEGGQNNIWTRLVLPLVHHSQSLCLAISALTALHISPDNRSDVQLHKRGLNLLLESLGTLRRELNCRKHEVATLATIILLASWTGWSEGLRHAKTHMNGASAVLSQIASQYLKQAWRFSPTEKCSMIFLTSTFFHISALSSLVRAAMGKGDFKVVAHSTVAGIEDYQIRLEILWASQSSSSLDPWLDCLSISIYLMQRAAHLCHEVITATSTSSTLLSR